MSNDKKILNEIAKNERRVSHPRFGEYLIKRPTNKIASMVETVRTKSFNRDLQTKEVVTDPETGQKKQVPAFLTRSSKARLLREHGEWTQEDEEAIEEAQQNYREVCVKLDDAGFQGTDILLEKYEELLEYLKQKLGDEKYNEVREAINVVIPVSDQLESDTIEEEDFTDPEGDYLRAKEELEEAIQDMEVISNLDKLDNLHKQYKLLLEGIEAQSELYALKLQEIALFSDTVESRADKAAQVAKVFHCVRDPDTKDHCWESMDACEDEDSELLSWLLSEVEKFERLDPSEDEESMKKKYRFNFLFPSDAMLPQSEDSHVRRESKVDGESQTTQ